MLNKDAIQHNVLRERLAAARTTQTELEARIQGVLNELGRADVLAIQRACARLLQETPLAARVNDAALTLKKGSAYRQTVLALRLEKLRDAFKRSVQRAEKNLKRFEQAADLRVRKRVAWYYDLEAPLDLPLEDLPVSASLDFKTLNNGTYYKADVPYKVSFILTYRYERQNKAGDVVANEKSDDIS